MNKITKKKINELLQDTGHALCTDDLDDIEALDNLASKITGTTRDEARLLSEPFGLCGIAFYPLTVAKSLWFAEKCEEWAIEGTEQEALLFWLLTVPNVTGMLDSYSDRKHTNRSIKRLSRRLHCSSAEMTDVYKKCVGISPTDSNDDSAEYGGLIDCLLREYGGHPSKWLYETPVAMIETLMNNYSARVNAENEANSKAAQHGKAVAPVASERLRALKRFREKANDIKDKWSQEDGA